MEGTSHPDQRAERSGISTLDFDYPAYARKHLDRFLAGASAPELDAWLEGRES